MIPISSAAPRPAASPAVREAERAREARPASPAASGSRKPLQDEYVPEGEKRQESCGRYWLGKDEDGSPKIYFDDPEAAKDVPASPGAAGTPEREDPEKDEEPRAPGKAAPSGGKEERCTGNTDAVDREIKKLKEKKEKLEKQLSSETDETKARELERKLSQVESELRQKDNDAYRRRHAVFTEG